MNSLKRNSCNLLTAALIVFGLSAVTGVNAQDSSDRPVMNETPDSGDKSRAKPGARSGQMTVEAPILMLVPVATSTDFEKKGCWVQFYDKKDYEGESLMLAGPVNMGRMTGPFGFDLENKVRSLKTGPKANLTIYDNRDFRDQDKFINANTKIPDMSEKMGFFDDFRSMMLSCT